MFGGYNMILFNKVLFFIKNEVLDIFSPLVFFIAGFYITIKFLPSLNEINGSNGAFIGLGITLISISIIIAIKLIKILMRETFNIKDYYVFNLVSPFIVFFIILFSYITYGGKLTLVFGNNIVMLLLVSLIPILINTIFLIKKRKSSPIFAAVFFMIIIELLYTIIVVFKMPDP